MSLVDVIVEKLQAADRLDAAAREAAVRLVQTHRAVLDRLEPAAVAAVLEALQLRGGAGAWDALTAHMDQSELLTFLQQTRAEMIALTAARAEAIAAWDRFAQEAGATVLRAAVGAILSVL